MNIILLGPPASGKGTFCERLIERTGLIHIAVGDLLRDAMKNKTLLGQKVAPYVKEGKLVPDEIILKIVHERLIKDDCISNGWLLDGFPRTEAQANSLHSFIQNSKVMILEINVQEDIICRRICNRRIDPETKKIYHLINNPPKCNKIFKRLVQREDDTVEKVKSRLCDYNKHIASIKNIFLQHNMPVHILTPNERYPDDPVYLTNEIYYLIDRHMYNNLNVCMNTWIGKPYKMWNVDNEDHMIMRSNL